MLTPREIEVLQLLSRGCSYAGVASVMGISVHTVGSHIKNAYRKLEVGSAAAAVARGIQLGLLALEGTCDKRDALA